MQGDIKGNKGKRGKEYVAVRGLYQRMERGKGKITGTQHEVRKGQARA